MERSFETVKIEAVIWAMLDIEKKMDSLRYELNHKHLLEYEEEYLITMLHRYEEHFKVFQAILQGKEPGNEDNNNSANRKP